ncbi:TlpA family protein disulfide reductase [Nitrosophilus kaiyonis]|uniref:TlpA family protein disulfide reductase n=1 Tax=Nitrosophilus kaiyonis TaxID=2930200 RepID=UPI0024931880|nr:TlpA disulfide reductase family protein [Nitrosophilus kaiyonis]
MRYIKSVFTIFLAVFLLTGCSKESQKIKKAEQSQQQSNEKKKFELELQDINGSKISIKVNENGIKIENLDNKIVMLDFFATWCPPCKAEIPHLVNIQNRFGDKIKIIGILLEKDKNIGELKRFIQEFKINYFVSNSKDNFEIAKIIYAAVQAPRNMPIPLMVIFKDGKYKTHYLGAVPEEMIVSDIKNILGE